MKAHSSVLISNDMEDYAAATARCYLRNRSTVDLRELARVVDELNARVMDASFPRGFIEELYSPRDESRITQEDRVFYTRSNARRLDNYRRLLNTLADDTKELLMGPLLSRASVHANTAGVFKGFYKNKATRAGQFGGSGSDALCRITGEIRLDVPILSNFECECEVLQADANTVAPTLKGLDLAYVDPPYNQHPYGSNYFMLNLILEYQRPPDLSRVSGIPTDWKRSGYNVRSRSLPLLEELLRSIDATFLLISFNNEGFISPGQMRGVLAELGRVEVLETRYNAFRGSRSFENRPIHVTEQLFMVERS
jgi:adenine-specific DNA-methyltransferase